MPAVQMHDLPCDRKSQTQTRLVLTAGGIRLIETVKDLRQFIRAQTVAGIFEADERLSFFFTDGSDIISTRR